MNKQITTIVLAVVIAGGGGFYAGTKYAGPKSGTANFNNTASAGRQVRTGGAAGAGFAGGQRGAGGAGGFTAGEVISKDANGITLKLQDGGSKIILVSPSTSVMKNISGSLDDVVVGEQITITGSVNQDGSISASSIRTGNIQPQQSKP